MLQQKMLQRVASNNELCLNVAAKIVANNELRIEGIGKKKALGAIKAFSKSVSQQVFGSHFLLLFKS